MYAAIAMDDRINAVESRINFWCLPLAQTVRRRLAAINELRHRSPRQKMVLADRLLSCAYDTARGLYVPLVRNVRTLDKLTEDFSQVPSLLSADTGTPLSYFSNALLLPVTGVLGSPQAVKPMHRITNAGFIAVTIEHDPSTKDEFEEIFSWTETGGKLLTLDKELRRYRDYDGYCVVWSGNKSLHMHFLFDTTHLANAPSGSMAEERWKLYLQHAAVMATAHSAYFDSVCDASVQLFGSRVTPDPSLRSHAQFRRMPWGVRILEQDSDLLQLKAGTALPQLVLVEKIRFSRSAKGAKEYLVAPDLKSDRNRTLSIRPPVPSNRMDVGSDLLTELATLCRSEWKQEFPKPVKMWRDREEWVFNFKNHLGDDHPSTVCRGDHNALLIQGEGDLKGKFLLPGELTANEMGDLMALRFGLISSCDVSSSVNTRKGAAPNYFEGLKRKSGRSFRQAFEEAKRIHFPHPSTDTVATLQAAYRDKLRAACSDARSFNLHAVVLSAEGIGKTRALFNLIANEAFDNTLSEQHGPTRFCAFAFRSEAQAQDKAREYSQETGRRSFVWRSFWSYYSDVCESLGQEPIAKSNFRNEADICSLLSQLKYEQPGVFEKLEGIRRNFWGTEGGCSLFDPNTIVFTTHATVMTWLEGRLTRTWHHPKFDPAMSAAELDILRKQAVLQDIVFDEPEFDELVWLLTPEMYAHLASVTLSDWTKQRVAERRAAFDSIRRKGAIPPNVPFEAYSELRYLDLKSLERVLVDFDKQPFGRENSIQAIYRDQHQTPYYLGIKRWPFSGSARITYLTTERFTTEAISAVYAKAKRPMLTLQLDELPGLYPIGIPVSKDRRAKAQRIEELAREILASNDAAIVIANGVGQLKDDRALTFQKMKGSNEHAEKDVFIIVTFLAPEVYGKLNVLGQWIGEPDTVAKFYAAQISQAVGRNTGFRQKVGTKTVVVATSGLLRLIQTKLARFAPRVRLELTPEAFW